MKNNQYLFFQHCYDCSIAILNENNMELLRQRLDYQVSYQYKYEVINMGIAIDLPAGKWNIFFDEKFRKIHSKDPMLEFNGVLFREGVIGSNHLPKLKIYDKQI